MEAIAVVLLVIGLISLVMAVVTAPTGFSVPALFMFGVVAAYIAWGSK